MPVWLVAVVLAVVLAAGAGAQTFPGSDVPIGSAPAPADVERSAPPARPRDPGSPIAKQLFGGAAGPAPLAARAIGFYSRGCLAGARPLAIDGSAWQAMRLTRNRFWGHPTLVAFVEKLAKDAQRLDGWPGLLVGDMSQPRGGPMLTGHESHQIGLDADIWLTPMPPRRLSATEREELSATSMLGAHQLTVDPQVWSEGHVRLVKRAAGYPEVERVLVHPGIKKALCTAASEFGPDRVWLGKVRPYWGHHYHMHVRLKCPPDSPDCRPQAPTTADDGCGKELVDWFTLLSRPPPRVPAPPKPPLTMADLPTECRVVIDAGSGGAPRVPAPAPTGQAATR